jgi:hypothetical protein
MANCHGMGVAAAALKAWREPLLPPERTRHRNRGERCDAPLGAGDVLDEFEPVWEGHVEAREVPWILACWRATLLL